MISMQYQLKSILESFASGSIEGITSGLISLGILVFWGWMLIDAFRREEYLWAVLILFFSLFTALMYFFIVYRPSQGHAPSSPGRWFSGQRATKQKIEELKAAIHHLDKPHLYLQLGDVYAEQNKWDLAEEAYRSAYERDQQDEDILAHYGVALHERGKPKEALPFLSHVGTKNPRHDYGETLMALAETQTELGQKEAALETWRNVLKLYSYPRARVQMAQLLIQQKLGAEARPHLEEVIREAPYAVKFQRKKDAKWVRLAKSLRNSV